MNQINFEDDENFKIIHGDSCSVLKTLPDDSINCCVTSPPYYALRDYGYEGQIGLEETPEEYIQKLVDVFTEVRRVLKKDGTCWINIADSYWGSGSRGFDFTNVFTEKSKVQQGSKGTVNLSNIPSLQGNNGIYKNKDLIGIPWMLAFALRNSGWYLRQDIIWAKTNCMPESVTDRCTKSHEYIFLLSKSNQYYFDHAAIQEEAISDPKRYEYPIFNGKAEQNGVVRPHNKNPNTGGMKTWTGMKNKRDVWTVRSGGGYSDENGAHYATYSQSLIEPCIKAGCPVGGAVLDPFNGTGTTGAAALNLCRKYIGIDMSEQYVEMSKRRLQQISDQQTWFEMM